MLKMSDKSRIIGIVAMRGRYNKCGGGISQQLELNNRGYTNTITTVEKDNLVLVVTEIANEQNSEIGKSDTIRA